VAQAPDYGEEVKKVDVDVNMGVDMDDGDGERG
jgi:hypothetical protein